jgi:protocatechuate 3,4-dioxygenase beta subunit
MRRPTLLLALACVAIAALCFCFWPSATPALSNDAGSARATSPATASTGAMAEVRPGPAGNVRTDVDATGAPAGASDSSLIVHVQWSDGTPAAAISVYVVHYKPAPYRGLAALRSDDSGTARLDHVGAGTLQVMSDRGGEVQVEVTAGATAEATLKLEAGVAVEGTVRDGSGAPVPAADIWLTAYHMTWMAGAVVAHADERGAFRVREVPKSQSLGALAPGFAPSELVDLDLLDTKTEPVHVALVLTARGGALAGRVVDARGNVVAGAMVAVGSADRIHDMRTSGTMVEKWSPRTVRTDTNGAFRIDSLQPGKQPVEVWATRFPFWHGDCEITAGATTELAVQLADGVTVQGTVSGADDKPLAAAIVRAYPVAIRDDLLQVGQYDYESTFGFPSAVADAAGRYRLERAAPGELHLYAGRGPTGRMESVPWASAVLAAEPGATITWNPKVDPGLTIAGVVRHRDGVPMSDLFVTALDRVTGKNQALTTDRQGRFRFLRLQNRPYDLSVQLWSAPKDAPPLQKHDVWPGQGEVELVAAFDSPKKLAPGIVRGRVDDPSKRIKPGTLSVVLQLSDRSWQPHDKLSDDKFSFTDVNPGRLQVIVMSGESAVCAGSWFELQPAEDKDLGVIVVPPAATLRLHLERGPGAEELRPVVYLRQLDVMHGCKVEPGTASEYTTELTPGIYEIRIWSGAGVASLMSEAKVVAGAENEVTLRLRAAGEREIVVDYPEGQRLTRIHVQEGEGTVFFDYEPKQMVERPYTMKLQLPVGRFVFEAATGSASAKLEFEMTSLQPGQPPVRLEVR